MGWVFVADDSGLAFPVDLPDGLQLSHAVGGLVTFSPAESAGFVLPAVEGVSECGCRLHPDDNLVEKETMALKGGDYHRLPDMGVPDVDGGFIIDVGEAGVEGGVQKFFQVLDVDFAVDMAPVLARGLPVVDRAVVAGVVDAVGRICT